MLGEVFNIFHPCLGTLKITCFHYGMRIYYSKCDLKLFFYSYTSWMSETQTRKASLTMWAESRREAQHWIQLGMEKEERHIPSSALLPQGPFQRAKPLCSSTTSPFLHGVVPKAIFHCSPNELLVLGILWLLGSILCVLCWYKKNINIIWEGTREQRAPMKNFRPKSAQQIHPELCAAAGHCNKD